MQKSSEGSLSASSTGADPDSTRQRGASLVEMAIAAPLLILLLFGIVDFGFVLNDTISLRQGARDGARQAVTSNIGTDSTCTTAGFSSTPNTSTLRMVCMIKSRTGLDPADLRVKVDFEGASFTPKESLAVCLMYPIGSLTGLFSGILGGSFKTKTQMRIEQAVAGVDLQEVEENSLLGEDWTWCLAETTAP